MTSYIFVNVIANGQVDFKSPYTAAHQPSIKEAFGIWVPEEGGPICDLDLMNSADLNLYSDETARGAVVVGHSVEFHHGYLRADMIRRGTDPRDGLVKTICTMLGLTGHVPKFNGRKGWPNFKEVCHHFGIERTTTETAEDNARCLKQAFEIAERAGVEFKPKTW